MLLARKALRPSDLTVVAVLREEKEPRAEKQRIWRQVLRILLRRED